MNLLFLVYHQPNYPCHLYGNDFEYTAVVFLPVVLHQIFLYSVIQMSSNISFEIQISQCVSDDGRHCTFSQV